MLGHSDVEGGHGKQKNPSSRGEAATDLGGSSNEDEMSPVQP